MKLESQLVPLKLWIQFVISVGIIHTYNLYRYMKFVKTFDSINITLILCYYFTLIIKSSILIGCVLKKQNLSISYINMSTPRLYKLIHVWENLNLFPSTKKLNFFWHSNKCMKNQNPRELLLYLLNMMSFDWSWVKWWMGVFDEFAFEYINRLLLIIYYLTIM